MNAPDFHFLRNPETEHKLKKRQDNFPDFVKEISVVQESPVSNLYYVMINGTVAFQSAELGVVADWLEESGFNTLAQWAHEKAARD